MDKIECADCDLTVGFICKECSMESHIMHLENVLDLACESLKTIITEYNCPPYSELDWYSWKQRAEKTLKQIQELREVK